MERKHIEVPSLTHEDFHKILPPSMVYPGLNALFGHLSPSYLKQIATKMNSYTWFRYVEQESKSMIFKSMATQLLYKMLKRKSHPNICSGNENGHITHGPIVGLSSRGVNYKAVNEDGIGIFENDQNLRLVVCDGVGDCLVGEVASYVILEEFRKAPEKPMDQVFSDAVKVLVNLGDELIEEIPEFITFPNEVSQAAVTGVQIQGDFCEVCQVGDVLLYHLRGDDFRLLDQNRSWLDLDQLNRLFADEQYLAQRHIISNAVGRNYDPYWNPISLELKAGDLLILASDGLETLHPADIKRIVVKSPDPQEALEELYHTAIEANLKWNTVASPIYTKPDNISLVIYRHNP